MDGREDCAAFAHPHALPQASTFVLQMCAATEATTPLDGREAGPDCTVEGRRKQTPYLHFTSGDLQIITRANAASAKVAACPGFYNRRGLGHTLVHADKGHPDQQVDYTAADIAQGPKAFSTP